MDAGGNMKNIDKVLATLMDGDICPTWVTTQMLAEILQMERTLVSRLLNQLVEVNKVIKQDTRPVLYKLNKGDKKTVFDDLIGAKGSLYAGIEQCKSAVTYPGGLTILITGHSGVGKSHLATLVFQYAKQEKIIQPHAKFVVFNCADYANNEELLASKLFGYKQGAFTGALEDNEGIIAQADGGYLFLDEVHRLSPEGQEKLFLLLDKGIYQQLGGKDYHKVKVRLICATTENPKTVLIETFLRRIPMVVNLPNLIERDMKERLAFIEYFYCCESALFHKKIKVSKEVVNYLLTCFLPGNIGELLNIIKVSCANASRKAKEEYVFVDIKDVVSSEFPKEAYEYYQEEILEVSEHIQQETFVMSDNHTHEVAQSIQEIYDLLHLDRAQAGEEMIIKRLKICTNRISDVLYFHNFSDVANLYNNLFSTHIEKGLKLLTKTYGIRYYGNSVKTIASVLLSLQHPSFQAGEDQSLYCETLGLLKLEYFKYNLMAQRMLQYLKDSFNYNYGVIEELYVTIYILSLVLKKQQHNINVVILAHGYSTASSIASLVNQLYSSYLIEAFDMPIDMEPMDIVSEIKKYAQHLSRDHGTIFLVDMGSLFDIYTLIKDSFDSEVVVINNISTHLALAVGSMVMQGKTIIEIVDSVMEECEMKYKYYERKSKKRAIVTTCASGIGTAYKIRDMIKRCIVNERYHVEVVSCDYFTLKNMGEQADIFNKYDVQLIITTLGLHLPNVPTMLFSELFSRENEDKIREVFKKFTDEESIAQIINNLMKMLTLENVISRLIILNPTKVIDSVDSILNLMEEHFQLSLDSNLKLTLYIHIAIMIERCVLMKDDVLDEPVSVVEKAALGDLRDIFEECLGDFDVEISDRELLIISKLMKEYQKDIQLMEGEDE